MRHSAGPLHAVARSAGLPSPPVALPDPVHSPNRNRRGGLSSQAALPPRRKFSATPATTRRIPRARSRGGGSRNEMKRARLNPPCKLASRRRREIRGVGIYGEFTEKKKRKKERHTRSPYGRLSGRFASSSPPAGRGRRVS